MATFEETCDWLARTHAIADKGPVHLILRHSGQRVRVVHCNVVGESWVIVASAFCEEDLIPYDRALQYNRTGAALERSRSRTACTSFAPCCR